MKPSIIAAAVAVGLFGGAARAQVEDATRSDVRCLLGFTALLQNPAYKDAAGAGIMYYAGRLDGRDSSLDLATAMKREVSNMATSDYMAEAQRCGRVLKARSETLKTVGEAMKSGR